MKMIAPLWWNILYIPLKYEDMMRLIYTVHVILIFFYDQIWTNGCFLA